MTNIYLAKSNRCNPDYLIKVRAILNEYSNNINIFEYNGGPYTHNDLEKCDILLIIPDLSSYNDDDSILLGKGLHEQIVHFNQGKKNSFTDILIVLDVTASNIVITSVTSLDILDDCDYLNYSAAILDEICDSLSDLLENRFVGLVDKDKPSWALDSEFKFLLIRDN
jgi:hypothetical protein